LGWTRVLVAIAVLTITVGAQGPATAAEEATPVALAETPTGLFTARIQYAGEYEEGSAFVGGQCLLVFDNFPAEGDPIVSVCDGGPEDQDARDGIVVFPLPLGVEYGFALDPTLVPERYEAEIAEIIEGPLTAAGGSVGFILVPDGVTLDYFVGLADGRPLEPGYPSGVAIDGACFVLQDAGGNAVGEEHCSQFLGSLWWDAVWLGSYTLVPTSLPDGCAVDEVVGDQPFVVTQEMVDVPPGYDHAYPEFWGGWVILDCDPAALATITLHAATCSPDEPDPFAACHGNALEGLALAPEEGNSLPLLVSGPDGTDSVQVLPGHVYLAQLDPNFDWEQMEATIDFDSYVYCAEQRTGTVLFDGRVGPVENDYSLGEQGEPVEFDVAAGDDVVCDWYDLTSSGGHATDPTPIAKTPTPAAGGSGVTTLPKTGGPPAFSSTDRTGVLGVVALLLVAAAASRTFGRRNSARRRG
jgi:hypothetical protein